MDEHRMPDGRVWRQVDAVLHTKKDGDTTPLIVWEIGCAVCGVPVQIKTPIEISRTKAFLRKHCEAHKKPIGSAWRRDK